MEEPDFNGCHLKEGVPILFAFLGGGVVSEPGQDDITPREHSIYTCHVVVLVALFPHGSHRGLHSLVLAFERALVF